MERGNTTIDRGLERCLGERTNNKAEMFRNPPYHCCCFSNDNDENDNDNTHLRWIQHEFGRENPLLIKL